RPVKFQLVDLPSGFACRKIRELIDCLASHAHMSRDRIQTRTVTARTFMRFGRIDPLRFALGRQLVLQTRIAVVVRASLKFLVPDFAEAAAFFACAVWRIE